MTSSTVSVYRCDTPTPRYLIPLGLVMGADNTVAEYIYRNQIPVTIGNILAGVIPMSLW